MVSKWYVQFAAIVAFIRAVSDHLHNQQQPPLTTVILTTAVRIALTLMYKTSA